MNFLGYVISLLITGLVIGALGRLAVPGRNQMSLGMTILLGIAGAFIGGVVAAIVGGGVVIALLLEVAAAAVLVMAAGRNNPRRLRRM